MIVPESSNGNAEIAADQCVSARAERKAQSRRRILDSAREVFFRDGFMAANLDEVAERAGVAKGTLYRYFESKADLYVEVLADNGDVYNEKMSEVVADTDASASQVVSTLSQFYLDWWLRHPEYFQIFWAIDNQAVIGELPAPVVAAVSQLWERSLGILDEVLTRGVREGEFVECDTWEVANMLWTTANAVIQSESTETRRALRRKPLNTIYENFVALFIRGLQKPT
jgi:AcrR family transcriptional regulator